MATVNEKMTAIANEIRTLSGTTNTMGLDAMATNVNEANVEIDDQTELLAQAIAALEGKAGGGGVSLPELTNEGSASDLLSGKQLIDSEGKIVEGTIETKTASNLTATGAIVSVPAGYYPSLAIKIISSGSAKTPATTITKTPTISVNTSGLITASVSGTQNVTPTVSAGYVSSGTAGTITVSGSTTKQLTTQAAKTVTPSTSSQTAIASGVYTTGAVTVAGDANLVASNIKSGVSIFGVTGTYEGSGSSGGASVETCTVNFEYGRKAETSVFGYSYLAVVDGGIQNVFSFGTTAGNSLGTIDNMLCGSYLYVYTQQFDLTATSTGDIEVIYIGDLFYTYTGVSVFRMPRTAGDTATVLIEMVT